MSYEQLKKDLRAWSNVFFEMSEEQRRSGHGKYVLHLIVKLAEKIKTYGKVL